MNTRLVAAILLVAAVAIAEEPVPQFPAPTKPSVAGVSGQSPREQAHTDPPTSQQPATAVIPILNADAREPYKLGTVLEGSSLATLEPHAGRDQHAEQLCDSAESLLAAASQLKSLPDQSSNRIRLIHEMRKEAAVCLREAGY